VDKGPVLGLEVIAGPLTGRVFDLVGHTTFVVGRGPGGVHLALAGDPGISRVHFLIEYNPPRARLADLRSKNGTLVNGVKVEQIDLHHGDEVRAGQTTLRVRLPAGDSTIAGARSTPPVRLARVVVPGYTLEAELGRGGMGVVHRARRNSDGRTVAVKTVLPASPEPESLARFLREMAILERLNDPNIVAFLGSGESGGLLYFVMEYVEGRSAGQVVEAEGPLAPERVVAVGCQLLDALGHAHEQGFVHRDVKPGNVLSSVAAGRERVKLADFGLARAYQASALSGLTLAGTPGGTPEFMPPEQVLDFRNAQPEADQYGAAATLYYLLTGQPIYERADSPLGLLWRIMTSAPIPLRAQAQALPGQLGAVLGRALARQPRQRFADALAMRSALVKAL
jgi:serine/threonine-protein kinase